MIEPFITFIEKNRELTDSPDSFSYSREPKRERALGNVRG